MDEIEILAQKIDKILSILSEPRPVGDKAELYKALSLAQGQMPPVVAAGENPYWKQPFVMYDDLRRAANPSLSENGLSVADRSYYNDDGQEIMEMTIHHTSGASIPSIRKVIPPKSDTKTYESYKMQLRKDMFMGLVGITYADADDDGEYANRSLRAKEEKGVALNTKYDPKKNKLETITKEQLEELEYELGDHVDVAEQVLDALKIQALADMPKSQYMTAMRRIREIKKLRDG